MDSTLFYGASFTPRPEPPLLTRRTPRSFSTDDPAGLMNWLADSAGYTVHDRRSSSELARLTCDGALVVIYHSGSVLCQGGAAADAVALLAQYAEGGAQ